MDRRTNHVIDMLHDESLVWNETLIRGIFESSLAEAILSITLSSHPGIDTPLWIKDPKGKLGCLSSHYPRLGVLHRRPATGGMEEHMETKNFSIVSN